MTRSVTEIKAAKAAKDARYYAKHKVEISVRSASYYQRHKVEIKANVKRWKAEHHERVLGINKAEYRRNISRKKAYTRQYTVEHKQEISEKMASRYVRDKERILSVGREWVKRNRGKVRAKDAKRRAAQLSATPPWLTAEQFKRIEALYIEAHRFEQIDGIARHVDHIYPLQGKTVSGLHVPWNLQILTATENWHKLAKMPVKV